MSAAGRNISLPRIRARARFHILLALMLGLLLAIPVLEGHPQAMMLVRLMLSAILAAAIYAASRRTRDLVIALVLGVPAIVGRWLYEYSFDLRTFGAVTLLTAMFLGYAAFVIVSEVARSRRVTFDTISGAICGYLLIGLMWGFLYSVAESVNPGALTFQGMVPPAPHDDLLARSQLLSLVYFSFITLTSTGFGDILPMLPVARTLAMLEAIIGQFYVAVLIARLVSLQIVHAERHE